MVENNYKFVSDLMEDVEEIVQKIADFPKEIKILEAKLYIGENSWGGRPFYIYIKYQISDEIKEKLELECCTISDTVRYILSEIAKYYKRTHKV